MSYLHIENLYKNRDILLFKECYAEEKIDGTSGNVSFKNGQISFFAGGASHEMFLKLFDEAKLIEIFKNITDQEIVVFGEIYAGKIQGRSDIYGKNMKFVVFEVKINEMWLNVPDAEKVAQQLGLEFVHYVKIPATLEAIESEMMAPSVQAKRNGIECECKREGVVLRPLMELKKNNGERIIVKHKREDFSETKTPRKLEVDPEKLKVLEDANAIAEEWVTVNRIGNIFTHLSCAEKNISNMPNILKIVLDDILRESKGEILDSKETRKAISKKAVEIIKSVLLK